MERRFLFPVRQAPDPALAHLEAALERDGFRVERGREHDVDARSGAERVLVGLAPHPEGLVARVKGKTLIPGRAEQLVERAVSALSETLGTPQEGGGADG